MTKTPVPSRPPARPAPKPHPDHEPAPEDIPEGEPAPPVDEPPGRMPARHEEPVGVGRRRAAPVRVRATRDGYYGDKYRRTGDVFTLHDPLERPARWMDLVDPETPEHTTSHGEALQEQRVEVMTQRAQERAAGGGVQVGPDNPDDGLDPIGARES